MKNKEFWLWFAVGLVGGPVAAWGGFALLYQIPAIAELLDALFKEYWAGAIGLGVAASFLHWAIWLCRVRKHGWMDGMSYRGQWLLIICGVPCYGATYYLYSTDQLASALRRLCEIVDQNLAWLGWVGLFSVPILLLLGFVVLLILLSLHNMNRTQERRTAAVEAAKKPVPQTDPEQLSLFKAGLIE